MTSLKRTTVVFRTLGWNLFVSAMVLLFALVSISGAAVDGVAAHIAFGAPAAVLVVVATRAVRAGVVVSDRTVTIRGFVRTHHLAWSEIVSINTVNTGNITGSGFCVSVTLQGGRSIRARGCGSYSRSKIERMANAIAALQPSAPLPSRSEREGGGG